VVNRAGYASPIRTPRGRDIMAACGQLKSASEKLKASLRRVTPLPANAGGAVS
jgi:23S rRNA (adenine2503-C2)-methyltransferase